MSDQTKTKLIEENKQLREQLDRAMEIVDGCARDVTVILHEPSSEYRKALAKHRKYIFGDE
jgi:hypothetical protein